MAAPALLRPVGYAPSSVAEPPWVPVNRAEPPSLPFVHPDLLRDSVNRADQSRVLRDIVNVADPSIDEINKLVDVTGNIMTTAGLEPHMRLILLKRGVSQVSGWLSSAWEGLQDLANQVITSVNGPFYNELLRDQDSTYMAPLVTALLPFTWSHRQEVDGLRGIQNAYERVKYHSARIFVILRVAYPDKVNLMDYTYELEQMESQNQTLSTQTIIAAMTAAMDRTMSADRGLGLTDSRDFFGMDKLSRHIAAFQYSLSELTSLVAQMEMQSPQQRLPVTPAGYNMLLTLDLLRSKMYQVETELARLRKAGYTDGVPYLIRDQSFMQEYQPEVATARYQLMRTQLRSSMLSLAFDGRLRQLRDRPENMQLLGEIDQLSRVFDRTWRVYEAESAHTTMDRVLPFATSDYPGLYSQAVQQYPDATNDVTTSLQDEIARLASQNGTQAIGQSLGLQPEDINVLKNYDATVRFLISRVVGLANDAADFKSGKENTREPVGDLSLTRVLEMCANQAVEDDLRYYDKESMRLHESVSSFLGALIDGREVPRIRQMVITYRDDCLRLTQRYSALRNALKAGWGARIENEAMQLVGNPELQKIYVQEGMKWAERFNAYVEQHPTQLWQFLRNMYTLSFSGDSQARAVARGSYNWQMALGKEGVRQLMNSVKRCLVDYVSVLLSVLESFALLTGVEREAAKDVIALVAGGAASVATTIWLAGRNVRNRQSDNRECCGVWKNSRGDKPAGVEITRPTLQQYVRYPGRPIGSGASTSSWWSGSLQALRKWCWYNPKTDTVETAYADFQGTLGLFSAAFSDDPLSIWHPSKARLRAQMDELDTLGLLMLLYICSSF